ncbi:hypothetical protein TNCV_1503211 [Trichonephila clavipes]|uniref:Uncharacterized protein n=1 Tax=Trichonephila clavipes TaxID=2585209 RepID=A0A8X6V496_TRICX|nr:hypothetical protein TNCV_1503211 [Trichonephila clavipes]
MSIPTICDVTSLSHFSSQALFVSRRCCPSRTGASSFAAPGKEREQSNPAGPVNQGGIGFELLLRKPCWGVRRRGPIPREARANTKIWRTSKNQVRFLRGVKFFPALKGLIWEHDILVPSWPPRKVAAPDRGPACPPLALALARGSSPGIGKVELALHPFNGSINLPKAEPLIAFVNDELKLEMNTNYNVSTANSGTVIDAVF